jgi:L-lactate dehydrogenase complex protein LldG
MPSNARGEILQKIKRGLQTPTPLPFDGVPAPEEVFAHTATDADILFAENFTRLQGNFSFCLTTAELVQQLQQLAQRKAWGKWFCNDHDLRRQLVQNGWSFVWHEDLASCNVAITGCEALVARTGSMVLSSQASGGRAPSVYAPAHVCVAYSHQLVYNIGDALSRLQKKYPTPHLPSLISFASGPSRTADIEKTLVTGVHGPKEVFCFLLDS